MLKRPANDQGKVFEQLAKGWEVMGAKAVPGRFKELCREQRGRWLVKASGWREANGVTV